MKNILIVFTGGTIGSSDTEGTIDTSGETPFKLLRLFEQEAGSPNIVKFTTIQPLQILSENLTPAAWAILISAIESENKGQYDGIIVTHGTDTLAYTAGALSFYFHAMTIPILLVSSNYPLDNSKANGLENFICAIEFIHQIGQPGVFVPYRNPHQTMQLHLGTRISSSLQLSGDFISVQNKCYMTYENCQFSVKNPIGKPEKKYRLHADFPKTILLIRPYPGLNYDCFDLTQVDAVLHDLYHSGTACSSEAWGRDFSLPPFIKGCRDMGISIYLAPAIHSENAYQSTRSLLDAGAKMIWNMSLESAYVKLMLAYGNFRDSGRIIDFINDDVANEHINLDVHHE